MPWLPDLNGDTFKREDGAVIERSTYSGDSWEAVIRDASDVRCRLRNKQGHIRRWKSPAAAMKAVDREFPAATPLPEPAVSKPAHLSAVERHLLARVQQSNGGCFPGVGDIAGPLVERGVLTGGPVPNFPNYWQLRVAQ